MQVLVVEPGKEARPAEINGSLKSMQEIVGGLIQAVSPWDDRVALICNEEAKLWGLPLNRLVGNDIIAGTFFVCGVHDDSFCSLPGKMMEKYQQKFQSPELFFGTDSGIVIKQCSPEEYERVVQERAEQAKAPRQKKSDPER